MQRIVGKRAVVVGAALLQLAHVVEAEPHTRCVFEDGDYRIVNPDLDNELVPTVLGDTIDILDYKWTCVRDGMYECTDDVIGGVIEGNSVKQWISGGSMKPGSVYHFLFSYWTKGSSVEH